MEKVLTGHLATQNLDAGHTCDYITMATRNLGLCPQPILGTGPRPQLLIYSRIRRSVLLISGFNEQINQCTELEARKKSLSPCSLQRFSPPPHLPRDLARTSSSPILFRKPSPDYSSPREFLPPWRLNNGSWMPFRIKVYVRVSLELLLSSCSVWCLVPH